MYRISSYVRQDTFGFVRCILRHYVIDTTGSAIKGYVSEYMILLLGGSYIASRQAGASTTADLATLANLVNNMEIIVFRI